jgi:hypothetical protein
MTYKEKILEQLTLSKRGHTCAELVTWIQLSYPEDKDRGKRQLMGTISGILCKLHIQGEVHVSHVFKGIRGGKIYYI